jgi:hypothetical protein
MPGGVRGRGLAAPSYSIGSQLLDFGIINEVAGQKSKRE